MWTSSVSVPSPWERSKGDIIRNVMGVKQSRRARQVVPEDKEHIRHRVLIIIEEGLKRGRKWKSGDYPPKEPGCEGGGGGAMFPWPLISRGGRDWRAGSSYLLSFPM